MTEYQRPEDLSYAKDLIKLAPREAGPRLCRWPRDLEGRFRWFAYSLRQVGFSWSSPVFSVDVFAAVQRALALCGLALC